ncbi:MAG: hypothetical protein OXN17_04040 [Candidatus Poribacteria bacterium]|nr:hypothetical protein [Candidatus Poribacteria bacterium]MDE0503024.1 hypothetical protein [Candidatus Poribacteria bacterium]
MLRFLLVQSETYKVLNMKLSGSHKTITSVHSFEAIGVVSGGVGHADSVETSAGTFANCLKIQFRGRLQSVKTTGFQHLFPRPLPMGVSEGFFRLLESEIHQELTDLMKSVTLELGLETVWLSPGVGPVKKETQNSIADLIDYETHSTVSPQSPAKNRAYTMWLV